jgi:hypothetical protein
MRAHPPIRHRGGVPLRVSLPRRDGQGHRHTRRTLILHAVVLALATACSAATPVPSPRGEQVERSAVAASPRPDGDRDAVADPDPFVAGSFDRADLAEASGVAVSTRNPGWVYVLDDGPGTRGVTAVDTVRDTHVDVVVDGLDGRDTEGLAVGTCDPDGARTCLFVGDIGNNEDRWNTIDVWRVPEPVLRPRRAPLTVTSTVSSYGYERAPVNAEALLVADGRPFLVTKERRRTDDDRTPRPHLLAADRWGAGTLRDLGPIPLPRPAFGLAAATVGNVVTGGDVRGDGMVVLRTYDHVVAYTPPTPNAPLETLPTWSTRELEGIPALPQPEGLAVDGCGLWLVSEGVDSLWLVPWAATGTPAQSDDIEELRCPSGDGGS